MESASLTSSARLDLEAAMAFIAEIDQDGTEEEKKRLIAELKRETTCTFMACGMTGYGKSSLLNGIMGRKVFDVGDSFATTSKVERYVATHSNKTMIILDTPGFEEEEEKEKEYMQSIRENCSEVDFLLYCVLLESRITGYEKNRHISTLTKLKAILNEQVWRNCVVVLTNANLVMERVRHNCKPNEAFRNVIKNWKGFMRGVLSEAGIDPHNIPIVPAGREVISLPGDTEDWLSILWKKIYTQSPENGQKVFFLFNAHRLTDVGDLSSYACDSTEVPIHQQPIVIDKELKENILHSFHNKYPKLAGAITASGVFAPVGAGIGAAVGAVAIGALSFGTAAYAGLVIGGVAGCFIGIGLGTAMGHARKKYSESEEEKAMEQDSLSVNS